nr:hypothetical protein CFP56_70290 [Quercus suber]
MSKFSVGRYEEALTMNQVMRTNLSKTEKRSHDKQNSGHKLPKQEKQSNGSLVMETEKGKMELDLWQGIEFKATCQISGLLANSLMLPWFRNIK